MLEARHLLVDSTDMDVLREMGRAAAGHFQSQKATVDHVAEVLGIHPNTVAARTKRMQEGGGMGSRFNVFPNPSAVGTAAGQFFVPLTMHQRTQETLDAVFRIGCTYVIIESLEGWTIFSVAQDEAGLDDLGIRICQILGKPSPQWNMRTSIDWPKLNGQVPMDDVAERLKLPPRTVHRRYQELRDAQAFRLYPFGEAIMVGLAFRYLQLYLPAPGKARAAAEADLERILTNRFTRQVVARSVQYLLYAQEQGQIQAQVEEAAAVPGVSIATNVQFRRMIINPLFPRQMANLLAKSR
ncbi:MAG: hypothetical protein HYT80_03255 [Euryarchaeota archaeon]|nr:hypothetical protein [Euryarchaeota archaeon]